MKLIINYISFVHSFFVYSPSLHRCVCAPVCASPGSPIPFSAATFCRRHFIHWNEDTTVACSWCFSLFRLRFFLFYSHSPPPLVCWMHFAEMHVKIITSSSFSRVAIETKHTDHSNGKCCRNRRANTSSKMSNVFFPRRSSNSFHWIFINNSQNEQCAHCRLQESGCFSSSSPIGCLPGALTCAMYANVFLHKWHLQWQRQVTNYLLNENR